MQPALLDTDIVSYFLKGNEKVYNRFQEYLRHYDTINISIITYYEIVSGLNFINASKKLNDFEMFCCGATIVNLTKNSVRISAGIYAQQRIKGLPIDDIDLLIAGIALSNNFVLVTNNVRHFGKIDNLQIENWNE